MPLDSARYHRRFYEAMIFCGLYTLIPFVLLNFYNHPSVDDFEFAIRDNQSSFFATQLETYYSWSGRYFATGIARINPIRFDSFSGYKACSFLLIVGFALTLHLFISKFFREFSSKQKLALTSLVSILYISQLPSVPQGLFWLSAYLAYQLPNILTLVLLLSLIHLFRLKRKSTKVVYTTLIVTVCAAIAGSNEMSLVYLMTSLVFLLFQLWRQQHQNFRYILIVFVCSLLASFIVVLAPGNYARMSLYPHDLKNFIWSFVASTLLVPVYFYKWGALLTTASVLYLLYWKRAFTSTTRLSSAFSAPIWVSLLHFIVTLFLMSFVFTWSRGTVPKPRAENVIYFFFVIGWFYNLHTVAHKLSAKLQLVHIPSIVKGALMLLFVRAVLDINNNISTAYLDLLSGKAAKYNEELSERYAYLQESWCVDCIVEPLSGLPTSLYVEDITTNNVEEKDLLVNRAYKKYWNKKAVFLAAPNPPLADNNIETLRLVGLRIKHVILGPGV